MPKVDMNRTKIIDGWFKNHTTHHSVLKDEHGFEVERLMWGEVGTPVCRVYYLRYGSVLMVFGDLGDAIYQWNGDIDLRWISTCDLSYFAGKCQASEEGRGYKVWSADRARERLDEIAAQEAEEYTSWSDADEQAVFDRACDLLTGELKGLGIEEALKDGKLWDEWVRQHPQHFGKPEDWSWAGMGDHGLKDIVHELVMDSSYAQGVAKEVLIRKWKDDKLYSPYNSLDSEHEWFAWMEHNGYDTFGDVYYEYGLIGMELSIRCEGHLAGLKKAFAQLDAQKETQDVKSARVKE